MISSLMNLVLLAGANPTWQSFDKLANSELGHMTKVVRNSNQTQHRKKNQQPDPTQHRKFDFQFDPSGEINFRPGQAKAVDDFVS